ncbi:MAG: LysM peptidoglycan-binding domain-containing protein [Chloroflexi bacterium]|nr:LysM peptidoglycan-binding domain-containing protein [Chloroflexota bacterium]
MEPQSTLHPFGCGSRRTRRFRIHFSANSVLPVGRKIETYLFSRSLGVFVNTFLGYYGSFTVLSQLCEISRMKKSKWISRLSLLVLCLLSATTMGSWTQFPRNFQAADDLVREVNSLRASLGLSAYRVNSILMMTAQQHADYLASIESTTYYGEDGSRPYQRALAAGYPVSGDLTFGGTFSESIYAGSNLSPAQVVGIWQGIARDLNTLTSPAFEDMGVGIAENGGVAYFVLDVGTATSDLSTIGNLDAPLEKETMPAGTGTPEVVVLSSTPLEDGTVYHLVRAGEALWSIASAYDMTVEELRKKNRLTSDDIFEGQKLLIHQPPAETPSAIPTITVTLGIPTSTSTRPMPPSPTLTFTPQPIAPDSTGSGFLIVLGIVFVAITAAGMGTWLSRKTQL